MEYHRVSTAADALTLQMLEWIASKPRTREEVLQVWRTSCPKLSIWEDACIEGLVEFSTGGAVAVSASGRRLLERVTHG